MAIQFDPNALNRFADVNFRKSDGIANLDGPDGLITENGNYNELADDARYVINKRRGRRMVQVPLTDINDVSNYINRRICAPLHIGTNIIESCAKSPTRTWTSSVRPYWTSARRDPSRFRQDMSNLLPRRV